MNIYKYFQRRGYDIVSQWYIHRNLLLAKTIVGVTAGGGGFLEGESIVRPKNYLGVFCCYVCKKKKLSVQKHNGLAFVDMFTLDTFNILDCPELNTYTNNCPVSNANANNN